MEHITLSQLNLLVQKQINDSLQPFYWIIAETSDVRTIKSGHCYLEFIEKETPGDHIVAKARGYIWASTYLALSMYFAEQTGQAFVSGLKVLVKVAVDFHPVYGYGLNVIDIDPTYTAGDMQQRRQLILKKLDADGILLMNKELKMPLLPQRIAVVTSPSAAGYEDFMNHLENNRLGFAFYPHLFPAVMQGEQTAGTIIRALHRIFEHKEHFDAVVIIRGGGASSDLASFDSYDLATNCAQFPLPVITGIGHERDETVLDYVAHYRAKTPTAAADYLITHLENAYADLCRQQSEMITASRRMLDVSFDKMQQVKRVFYQSARNFIEKQYLMLAPFESDLRKISLQFLLREENKLREKESYFRLSSPGRILALGYSITKKDGKTVKSAQSLRAGDRIETVFAEGKIASIVSSGAGKGQANRE